MRWTVKPAPAPPLLRRMTFLEHLRALALAFDDLGAHLDGVAGAELLDSRIATGSSTRWLCVHNGRRITASPRSQPLFAFREALKGCNQLRSIEVEARPAGHRDRAPEVEPPVEFRIWREIWVMTRPCETTTAGNGPSSTIRTAASKPEVPPSARSAPCTLALG